MGRLRVTKVNDLIRFDKSDLYLTFIDRVELRDHDTDAYITAQFIATQEYIVHCDFTPRVFPDSCRISLTYYLRKTFTYSKLKIEIENADFIAFMTEFMELLCYVEDNHLYSNTNDSHLYTDDSHLYTNDVIDKVDQYYTKLRKIMIAMYHDLFEQYNKTRNHFMLMNIDIPTNVKSARN